MLLDDGVSFEGTRWQKHCACLQRKERRAI